MDHIPPVGLSPGPEDIAGMTQVSKVILVMSAGAVGYELGGPAGAALGAGAGQSALAAVDRIALVLRQRAANNAARALSIAAGYSSLSPEGLIDVLSPSPESVQLLGAALEVAARTAVEEKISLMGRVLANAAADTALVNEQLLLVQAVRELEAPHIRVLALLAKPPVFDEPSASSASFRWTAALISQLTGWKSPSVTSVLLTLQSSATALLTPTSIDGGAAEYRGIVTDRKPVNLDDLACEITDFGSMLHGWLRDPNESSHQVKKGPLSDSEG